MQKKKPNKFPVFPQFFGHFRQFSVVLLAYLYTDCHAVSGPIRFC
jgi:hypothetical protein